MSITLIIAILLCILNISHSVEIRNASHEYSNPTNLSKPEVRSVPGAFTMFFKNITNPGKIKSSFLKDLVLELIDPGKGSKCDLEKNVYPIIRGVLADKLLKQNTRTYKDFSVVSSKEKQPLLYLPLLGTSIPSSSDIRYIENPLSTSGDIEDHNLRFINYCRDKNAPEGLGSKLLSHFKNVIMPNFPEPLQKLFNMILKQKNKLLKMYNIMKRLAKNRVQFPTYKQIRNTIQKGLDDMVEIKKRSELDCKYPRLFKDLLVTKSFQILFIRINWQN